jgi:peptidoglycan/LPS O-acetylase OafA/YrhL
VSAHHDQHGSAFGYSRALDGLRALAVTAVVLFHAGVGGLSGGFLGVDTFFVLSGFLITSLLLAERARSGHIRLATFWVRRARRLLPALLVVLLATVVAGRFLLDSDALGLLRTDAYAALAYVANWRMIFRGTGYVAATAAPSPLQHTWSLGIEEQFYLLWPLLVAGLLAWIGARWGRTVLLVFCVAGAVVSQTLCSRIFDADGMARAYYGTDTRAQALLIGAALAAALARTNDAPLRGQVAGRILGPLALVAVAVTGWLWHAASDQARWLFHGGLTVAALATAVVVAQVIVSPRAPLARMLGIAPMVWLGRISYGVYLWHWPVFTFVTADATGLARWPLLTVRLSATLAGAVLSFALIEQPIRRGGLARLLPRRMPTAVTAGALAAMVPAIAYCTTPPPQPVLAAAPVIITAPSVPARSSAPANRPKRAATTPKRDPRVTFLGDSVAWVIGTYLPPHPGMSTSVRAIQGCGIATLPDILQQGTPHTNYPGCTSWPQRWRRGIAKDDPDVAVIELNRWELMDRRYQGRYQHVGDPAYDAYLTAQLDEAIGIAGSRGAAVVLLTAAYTHRTERPDGSLYPEDQPARVDAWNALLRATAARHPGKVTVLDIAPLVCPDGKFTWRVDGMRVRSDGLHYTPAAVQRIIAPWLLPRLATIAATAPGK